MFFVGGMDKPAHRQVGKLDTWKLYEVMEVMGGFFLITKQLAVAVRGLLEEVSPQSGAEGER